MPFGCTKSSVTDEYVLIKSWKGRLVLKRSFSVGTIKYLVLLLRYNRYLYSTSFVSSRWQYCTIRLLCAVVSILNKVLLSIERCHHSTAFPTTVHATELFIKPSVITVASGPKTYISRLQSIDSLIKNCVQLTESIEFVKTLLSKDHCRLFKRIISCLNHYTRRLQPLHRCVEHSLPFTLHIPNLDLIVTDF